MSRSGEPVAGLLLLLRQRQRWRPLAEVTQHLPGRLPLMLAPTGRNRHLPAPLPHQPAPLPHHILQAILEDDENNQEGNGDIPDPAPPAPLEEVALEVAREGTSLQDGLKIVDQKIKDTVGTEDKKLEKQLRKLGRGRKYLKQAIAAETFELLENDNNEEGAGFAQPQGEANPIPDPAAPAQEHENDEEGAGFAQPMDEANPILNPAVPALE